MDFERIFPFINGSNIDVLAESLNNVTDRSQNYAVLDKWLDENWIDPKTVNLPKKYKISRTLKNIDGTRKVAHSYLKFRDLIWNYFEFLYCGTQDLGFFTEEEANKMDKIFWSYGPGSNTFRIYTFLDVISATFRKTHIYTRSSLKLMTSAFLEMNGISPWAGLNWNG